MDVHVFIRLCVYTDFSFYGGFCVDGHSGSSFISEGFDDAGGQMRKINTLGTEVASWTGNTNYQELWRLDYNSCQSQGVIIGGGTTANSFQTCNFDTTLVTMNPVQTVIISHIDLAMVTLDNVGNAISCLQPMNLSRRRLHRSIP